MSVVWIDVAMATGLSGGFRPLPELPYETPMLPPTTVGGWQQWATTRLAALAAQEL